MEGKLRKMEEEQTKSLLEEPKFSPFGLCPRASDDGTMMMIMTQE